MITVVILGERDIEDNDEYRFHETYSTYNDLVSNIDNYVDMTYESSVDNSDLGLLKRSCYIMNSSELNLYMTNSGLRSITTYISDNILGLSNVSNDAPNPSTIFPGRNISIVGDFHNFIDKLKLFILR